MNLKNFTSLSMTHTTTARPNFTWPRGSIPRAPGSCLRPLGARRIPINLPRCRGPVCSRERVSHLGYTRNKRVRRKNPEFEERAREEDTREEFDEAQGTHGQDEFRPRTDSDWSANTRWLDGSPSSQQRTVEKGDYCHSGSDFQSQSSKHDTKVCKRTYDNTVVYVDDRDEKLFCYHFHIAKRIKLL